MKAAAYLRGMAYHEAGHAVVAHAIGLDVHEIRVGIGDDGSTCWTAAGDTLADELTVIVAGRAAEELFEAPLPTSGLRTDRKQVVALLDGLSDDEFDAEVRRAFARACHILIEYRDKVIALARHLMEVRDLDQVGFRRLMASGCQHM